MGKKRRFCCMPGVIFAGLVAFNFACADTNHLVISQAQIAGAKTTDDFIELYNSGDAALNLNGYRLVKRTANSNSDDSIKSWTSDACVPAKGYYLWANNGYGDISAMPNATTTATIADNNGIAIRYGASDTGTLIDNVAWGTTANGFRNVAAAGPKAGLALWRQDLSDSSSAFYIASSSPHSASSIFCDNLPESTSTLATTSTPDITTTTYSTTVKINEILPNPVGPDEGNEAVELFNSGTSTVDLNGWFLSDSHGTSTAYQLPTSTEISANGFLVIVIPAGNFTLNNNGDTVNLYYPDLSLADTESYNTAAGDDKGWQVVSGVWLWAPQTLGLPNAAPPQASSSGNSGGSGQISSPNVIANTPAPATVQISEFMPNPLGDDQGKQWVELYNYGSLAVSLKGWILDDDASSTIPGSSAYVLGYLSVAPKNYLSIIIPKGKFALNNTGGDGVRLFKPDKTLLEKIIYSAAPEGLSFALDLESAKWSFTIPTPGAANIFNVPLPSVTISELLPNPGDDDDEFVEFFNATSATSSLENFRLRIGSHEKVLDKIILAPNSYFTLYEEDLPAKLRNSGQTVVLLDNWGRLLSTVTYPKSFKGQAFARVGGGFAWTEKPTPGQQNEMVLAASAIEPAKLISQPTSYAKSSGASVSSQTIKKLESQIALLTTQVNDLQAQAQNQPIQQVSDNAAQQQAASSNNQNNFTGTLALILAAIALLVVIVKYFV